MLQKNIGDELIQAMREAIRYMRNQDHDCITHKIKMPIEKKLGNLYQADRKIE